MNILVEQHQQQQRDVFDELPEAILLEIFNKIHDAKSLCFCLSTCKRFGSLIPLTSVVHLTLPSSPSLDHHRIKNANHRRRQLTAKPIISTATNLFKSFVNRVVLTPIRFLLLLNIKKSPPSSCSHCDADDANDFRLPSQILKNFNEIRSLRIELPRNVGDISNGSGGINKLDPLLKWKAEFGSQLQSCVILAANSSSSSSDTAPPSFDHVNNDQVSNNESPRPSYLSNDELKLRVVWTISCLIAASARHHMLKQIVLDHGVVENAVISDGSKQGKLSMDKSQVEDLRKGRNRRNDNNNNNDDHWTSPSMEEEPERSRVPALRMHMWYVPVLELPESGCVLNGATLVVIRPLVSADGTNKTSTTTSSDDELLAMGAFDSDEAGEDDVCVREAVGRMIKKKKAYSLEMSPF